MIALIPPAVIDVRVREAGARDYRIWFPLFLLWPVLLVLGGFALIVAAVVDLALWMAGASYHHYTLLLLHSLSLLSEARGTHAHVVSRTSLIDVDIY